MENRKIELVDGTLVNNLADLFRTYGEKSWKPLNEFARIYFNSVQECEKWMSEYAKANRATMKHGNVIHEAKRLAGFKGF